MRVEVSIEEGDVDTDIGSGYGLTVTCSRCGHSVEVLGTSDASERAACAILRETCPSEEDNWYEPSLFGGASLLDRIGDV